MTKLAIGAEDFAAFGRACMLASVEVQAKLAVEMRGVGQVVADRAENIISQFSQTIPSTIGLDTSEEGKVQVEARGVLAGLLELGNVQSAGDDIFQHPVFGNRAVWVKQEMHPFLGPAMHDSDEQADEALTRALDSAIDVAVKG